MKIINPPQTDIKKISLKKKKKLSFRTWLIIATIITAILLLLTSAIYVAQWFDGHKVVFTSPVKLSFFAPVTIQERKPQIIEKKMIVSYPGEIDTPIKKYICDKFGVYDCKIALAIVQAESGFNDQAMHVNDNGSVDLGCWQINFPTHLKTITPKDALDCQKATDWAFEKYKRDGNFNAWVTYSTGSYLSRL